MTNDEVNHPAHYTQGIVEVIDIIKQIVSSYPPYQAYCIGNVLKYIARAPHKADKTQDLEKAAWYLNRVIDSTQL